MKYTFTTEDLYDILLEYNMGFSVNDKLNTNVMMINKIGLGEVQVKTKQIKGINLIEWDATFLKQVRIFGDMENSSSLFSLYFNLGNDVEAHLRNKKMHIDAKSHNLWSFSGDENGFVDYKKGEESHSLSIVLEEGYLKGLVNRYPDLLTEIYTRHTNNSFLRWSKCDIPINNEINHVLFQIKNANLMGRYGPVYIEAKILELLVLQLHCPNKQGCIFGKFCKNTRDIDKMHEARDILLNNIETPPSIYELSRQVGVNDKKLRNGFKEVFKQTIYNCLFDYKMELARQLLLNTNKSIFEIALDCGYDYASHFTTAFKRKFGVTPKQFRAS